MSAVILSPQITGLDTMHLLETSGNKYLSSCAKNAELVKSLTAVINESLKVIAEPPRTKGQAVLAGLDNVVASVGLISTISRSKEYDIIHFGAKQMAISASLIKAARMLPNRAVGYITLATAEKIVAAAGLVYKNECGFAIAELAVTTGVSGFVCLGSGGLACGLSAIAIAAEAYNVYAKCYGPVAAHK